MQAIAANQRLSSPMTPANRALFLGWLSVIPLLVWWMGWFPGFLTSDPIDQLGQVAGFDFYNTHPIFHTFSMWMVTRVWDHPGAITLVQVILLAAVLGYAAKRLTEVGVPWWLGVTAAWVTAALPMVAQTTITIWKDIPYSIAMVWAFAELLVLARDRTAFWSGIWPALRLGVALGLMWALRANGWITVIMLLVALAIAFRDRWRSLFPTAAAVVGFGIVVPAVLLVILPVHTGSIEPAEVFLAQVAAVVVHDEEWFNASDTELLQAVAPIAVWQDEYQCGDSTPLLFNPEFHTSVARTDPWPYRSLVARTAITHIPTVAGHRWCASSYLFWPVQTAQRYLRMTPLDIPPNTLGIARDPISDRAFAATIPQYRWVAQDGVLWFTWRPAIVILAGIATYFAIALRRPLRPLLWVAVLAGAQLINVAATTPTHEFRYAFGVYLIALMSLPLWWLIVRPDQAPIE